ncbi:MAG: NAD-dependent epimerase/dehydratase family protein [Flavobacteriales bacterium]|jgi:dihydroflavonol-4-reductase
MNLITGITGLLGTHIALELLTRGLPVRGLRRPESSTAAMERVFAHYGSADLFSRIEWAEGDILDVQSLQDAMRDCITVYHSAALVSYHPKDRRMMYKVNTEGTANVVNAAIHLGVPELVHISSVAAIGRIGAGEVLRESSAWHEGKHTTHYAITKHLSEMEVWRGIQEGLQAVILNPGFVIGPGDFSRSSPTLFSRMYQGVPFYPPGGTGFISASDAARAAVELAVRRHFGERFIAVAENRSLKEVFSWVAHALGKPIARKQVTPLMLWTALLVEQMREWISGHKAAVTREVIRNMEGTQTYDSSKIVEAIGISFEPVEAAIRSTAGFFLSGIGKA